MCKRMRKCNRKRDCEREEKERERIGVLTATGCMDSVAEASAMCDWLRSPPGL